MNDNATSIKRRLVIAGAVGVLVLLAVGISILGTWYCDTTNVPAGGPTPVPAGALCLSGTPGGVVTCPGHRVRRQQARTVQRAREIRATRLAPNAKLGLALAKTRII